MPTRPDSTSGTAAVRGQTTSTTSKTPSKVNASGMAPERGTGTGIAPTGKAPAVAAPPDMGGGMGGGLGGGAGAPNGTGPTPLTDIDWFNQDGIYRQEAGGR